MTLVAVGTTGRTDTLGASEATGGTVEDEMSGRRLTRRHVRTAIERQEVRPPRSLKEAEHPSNCSTRATLCRSPARRVSHVRRRPIVEEQRDTCFIASRRCEVEGSLTRGVREIDVSVRRLEEELGDPMIGPLECPVQWCLTVLTLRHPTRRTPPQQQSRLRLQSRLGRPVKGGVPNSPDEIRVSPPLQQETKYLMMFRRRCQVKGSETLSVEDVGVRQEREMGEQGFHISRSRCSAQG